MTRITSGSDEPKPKLATKTLLIAIITMLVVTPVAYLLSVGPASWLLEHKYLDDDLVQNFYRPLFTVAGTFRPLASFLVWYITIWGGVV